MAAESTSFTDAAVEFINGVCCTLRNTKGLPKQESLARVMHDIQETIDANLEKGKGDNWRCAVDVDGRALKLQFIEALPMHARVRVTDRDQVVKCVWLSYVEPCVFVNE